MTHPIHTREQAKARAKIVRAERAAAGGPISQSAALERVAREHGYANWNAMSARLANAPESPLLVGDRVVGDYLKQPFEGVVVAVRAQAEGRAIAVSLEFDEAVDVVRFESFSNFRRRVNATISAEGVSYTKTSDGVPHLVVARSPESPD